MLDPKVEDLEALAETCMKTAKQIKEYLASNNLPQPTFDQNGPEFFPPVIPEIDGARLELRAAAKRLYDLSAGPDEVLTWHTYHCVRKSPFHTCPCKLRRSMICMTPTWTRPSRLFPRLS